MKIYPTLKLFCEAKIKILIPVFKYILGKVFNISQLVPREKLFMGKWKNFLLRPGGKILFLVSLKKACP